MNINILAGQQSRKKLFTQYNKERNILSGKTLCHASSKNILFVQGGKVMACHFNRGCVLGNYPSQTITDIINGDTLKALKNKLKHYHFPDSCFFCKNEIDNNRFYQAGCKKYDYLSEFAKRDEIISLEFQTSNICNLECVMCSGEYSSLIRKNREHGEKYPEVYDDNFISQIKPLLEKAKFVSFTGGEPFLNPLYYKIWNVLTMINPTVHITISTNGTILTDKIKELINLLNIEITASIDTLNPLNYEFIRKNATFQNALNNISYFAEISKQKQRIFSIKSVIMRENIEDFPELFEYFNEKDVQIYPKLIWVPPELSLRYGTSEEFDYWISVLNKCRLVHNFEIQKFNCERVKEIILTLEKWKEESAVDMREQKLKYDNDKLLRELKELFIEFISNDIMISYEKRNELYEYSGNLINYLNSGILDEQQLKQFLANILSLPKYVLINEYYRMDAEKFVTRLKAGK